MPRCARLAVGATIVILVAGVQASPPAERQDLPVSS